MLATHAAPAPAYVGIEEDDRRTPWRLDASRPRVRVAQGRARRRVVFSIRNYGMDGHDLAVRRVGTVRTLALSGMVPAASGGRPGTGRLEAVLPPGRYVLFCTVGRGTPASHESRGMRERFNVLRPSAG